MEVDLHDLHYVSDVARLPAIPPRLTFSRGPTKRAIPALEAGFMVDSAAYVDGIRLSDCPDPGAALRTVRETGRGFVWVGLFEPDAREIASLGEIFGLHELAVEDAVHAHQRPKLERYKRYSQLVLKTVRFVDHDSPTTANEIVETGEILIFLGADFIITVRHGEHSELAGLRKALEAAPERLALGPSAVMHAIADRIVDHYLVVADQVEDDIEELEELVFDPATTVPIEQIYLFKREMVQLRRAVLPLRAPLQSLAGDPSPLVPEEVRAYFRDVEDHLTQVADHVLSFDELLSALIAATHGLVSTQQNEDMRKISAWAAIALVPTAIAGIYGMNFEHIPGGSSPWGFLICILLMAVICTALYLALRKKKWL